MSFGACMSLPPVLLPEVVGYSRGWFPAHQLKDHNKPHSIRGFCLYVYIQSLTKLTGFNYEVQQRTND